METHKAKSFGRTQSIKSDLRDIFDRNNFIFDQLLYNNTDSLQSCSSFLPNLEQYERRTDIFLESGTSGDSSPCYSESEEKKRVSIPTLREAARVLADESSMELDPNYENIKTSTTNKSRLLITKVSTTMTKSEFKDQLVRLRLNDRAWDYYFKLRDIEFIFYNTEWSLKISIEIRRDSISDYLKMAFKDPKMMKLLGEEAKPHWIKDYKMGSESWFAVIFRNIPYFVRKENIEEQSRKENENVLYCGPKTRIKDVDCCLVRFASLEECETVCRRLHNMTLRCEGEKHFLKANVHPYGRYKHKEDAKSHFAGLYKIDFLLDAYQHQSFQARGDEISRSKAIQSSSTPTPNDQIGTAKSTQQIQGSSQKAEKDTKLQTEAPKAPNDTETSNAVVQEPPTKTKKTKTRSTREAPRKQSQTANLNIVKKEDKNDDFGLGNIFSATETKTTKVHEPEQPSLLSSLSLLITKNTSVDIETVETEESKREASLKLDANKKDSSNNHDITTMSTEESRKKEITPEKKSEMEHDDARHDDKKRFDDTEGPAKDYDHEKDTNNSHNNNNRRIIEMRHYPKDNRYIPALRRSYSNNKDRPHDHNPIRKNYAYRQHYHHRSPRRNSRSRSNPRKQNVDTHISRSPKGRGSPPKGRSPPSPGRQGDLPKRRDSGALSPPRSERSHSKSRTNTYNRYKDRPYQKDRGFKRDRSPESRDHRNEDLHFRQPKNYHNQDSSSQYYNKDSGSRMHNSYKHGKDNKYQQHQGSYFKGNNNYNNPHSTHGSHNNHNYKSYRQDSPSRKPFDRRRKRFEDSENSKHSPHGDSRDVSDIRSQYYKDRSQDPAHKSPDLRKILKVDNPSDKVPNDCFLAFPEKKKVPNDY